MTHQPTNIFNAF